MITDEDLMNLPAGLAMNLMIAQAFPALGWKVQTVKGVVGIEDEMPIRLFEPSSSLVHAWEVVEHIIQHGFNLNFEWPPETDSDSPRYCCGFGEYRAAGETAPIAICRAALILARHLHLVTDDQIQSYLRSASHPD
jgi:hypothetical protein